MKRCTRGEEKHEVRSSVRLGLREGSLTYGKNLKMREARRLSTREKDKHLYERFLPVCGREHQRKERHSGLLINASADL